MIGFKRTLLLILSLLVSSVELLSNDMCIEEKNLQDSVRLRVQPVVVYDDSTQRNRTISEFFRASFSRNREELRILNPQNITEVLAESPGVFIKNYGGISALKTVSLRGAQAAQTVVLLDGIPLNTTQNGLFDFSILSPQLIENIRLERGGASALYGMNSLGGTIIMQSKLARISYDSRFDTTQYSVHSSVGSFSTFNIHCGIEIFRKQTGWSIHSEATQSTANFPFISNQFGRDTLLNRLGNQLTSLQSMIGFVHAFSGWKLSAKMLLSSSARGVPGAVVQGNFVEQGAELHDNNMLFAVSLQSSPSSNILLEHTISYKKSYTKFRDERYSNNDFYGNDIIIQNTMNYMTNNSVLRLSIHSGYSTLQGDFLDPMAEGSVARLNAAFASSYSYENWLTSSEKYRFETALRADIIRDNDTKTAISPLVSLYIPFTAKLGNRTSISWNFRPPSFNEMYYLNYGNIHLRPERSLSISTGFLWDFAPGFSLELDGFWRNTTDQIVAVPISPVAWSARNEALVRSIGIENLLTFQFPLLFGTIRGHFSYTRQISRDYNPQSLTFEKELPYTPQEILSYRAMISSGNFNGGIQGEFSSFRYSSLANELQDVVPSYAVNSVFLLYHLAIKEVMALDFRCDIENLFDKNFQVVRNYPMPGRALRCGIRATW